MSTAFLPGFECAGDVPISNRRIPAATDDLGFIAAIPDLESDVVNDAPMITTAQFRARTFLQSLSRQQRATVASRRRFHSMPWIKPAGQDDTDQLP